MRLFRISSAISLKRVVLLENINAADVIRPCDLVEEDSDGEGSIRRKDIVTLWGLLNALDGVGPLDGPIAIIATNQAEKPDDSLIRPSRVNNKLEFRLAGKEVIAELFCLLFKQSEEKGIRQGAGNGLPIVRQVVRLDAEVPELVFSQAEIISYPLKYRNRPGAAAEHSIHWVTCLVQERMLQDKQTHRAPALEFYYEIRRIECMEIEGRCRSWSIPWLRFKI